MKSLYEVFRSNRLIYIIICFVVMILLFFSVLYLKEKKYDTSYIMPSLDYEVEELVLDNGCETVILSDEEISVGAETYLYTEKCDLNIKYMDFFNDVKKEEYIDYLFDNFDIKDSYMENVNKEEDYYEYIFENDDRIKMIVQNGGTVMSADTSIQNKEKIIEIFYELGYYYSGYQSKIHFYKNLLEIIFLIDVLVVLGLLFLPLKK